MGETLGLPVDSIELRFPSGGKANCNSTVASLRDKWK